MCEKLVPYYKVSIYKLWRAWVCEVFSLHLETPCGRLLLRAVTSNQCPYWRLANVCSTGAPSGGCVGGGGGGQRQTGRAVAMHFIYSVRVRVEFILTVL